MKLKKAHNNERVHVLLANLPSASWSPVRSQSNNRKPTTVYRDTSTQACNHNYGRLSNSVMIKCVLLVSVSCIVYDVKSILLVVEI